MADEIAYRDLKPGEVFQAGDQWQVESGQWSQIDQSQVGQTTGIRARRPYNITELLKQRDQAAHEYRLHREALTAAQAALKATMANGLQACKERDDAEQALKMARASLEEMRLARAVVIEERNEAERLLTQARAAQDRIIGERDEWRRQFAAERSAREVAIAERNEAHQWLSEERELHQITAKDRDECRQQRQHLQTALDELQRRQDAAEANIQANTMTVGEIVENILSALEIASHALEYLADVGVNEEPGHYCGFSAAIAVVRKIKESTK